MLEGEALYRDVFELTTPLLMDMLAFAFHLFGATLTTGRAVGGVIQALLVVAIYSGARAVGGRRAFAIAIAMVHLAIAQPAWPYTTPHWLAVLLMSVLLLISLDRRRARTPGWVIVQGLLLGLLIATRQHAGIAVGLGMTLLILFDALNDRMWGRAPGLSFGRHLVTLAASTLAGSVVVLGPHLVQAGFGNMLSQLVIHPLTGYRDTNQVTWGTNYLFELAGFTWPALLKYLPVVVAIVALRAAIAWLRRSHRHVTETLLVLAVFGLCALAFTMSYPDLIHLAMIMPILLIITAELLVFVLGAAGRWRGVAQSLLALALIIACTVQLQRNYSGAFAMHPILHDTEFGRLAFAKPGDVEDVEWVRDKLERSASRDLMCYPGWSALYLMTGARNPTRHEIIFPGYQSDEEVQDVIRTLERERVSHVLLMRPFIKPNDPVDAYVGEHYRCTDRSVFQFCARNDGD